MCSEMTASDVKVDRTLNE